MSLRKTEAGQNSNTVAHLVPRQSSNANTFYYKHLWDYRRISRILFAQTSYFSLTFPQNLQMTKITRIRSQVPIIVAEPERSQTNRISADHRYENGSHLCGHKTDGERSASKHTHNRSQKRTAVRDRVTALDGRLEFYKQLVVSVYSVLVQSGQSCRNIGSQAHIFLLG